MNAVPRRASGRCLPRAGLRTEAGLRLLPLVLAAACGSRGPETVSRPIAEGPTSAASMAAPGDAAGPAKSTKARSHDQPGATESPGDDAAGPVRSAETSVGGDALLLGSRPSRPAQLMLTASQREVFWSSPEDPPARELLGVRPGRAGRHYQASNERKPHLFRPRLADLGGGYVGVGSDQAYLFIGWMRPELAWLIDYDPLVVQLHFAYQALIAAHETPQELIAAFSPSAREDSLQAIARGLPPERRSEAQAAFRRARRAVWKRLREVHAAMKAADVPSWLTDQATYDFVRELSLAGRVRPMVANLLDAGALQGIAASARQLGVPIRAVYLSNAEEYWPAYSKQYRDNIESLPHDDASIVLRTLVTYEQNLDYHYNVQSTASYLAWLGDPSLRRVNQIVRHPRGKRTPRPPTYSETNGEPERGSRTR